MSEADLFLALPIPELQARLRENVHIDENVYYAVLRKLREILESSRNVLGLNAPLIVVGDIHGQLLDLFSMFRTTGGIESHTYLFLGDYVDRGFSSFETFIYLAYLKINYPTKVFLLRGNHESRAVNQQYGLYVECLNLYGNSGIWNAINDTFDHLPIAAVIDNRIFAVHGGISPLIALVAQLTSIRRAREIEEGPIADLTWSDPSEGQQFQPNSRGMGHTFGEPQSKAFLWNNRLGADGAEKDDPNHGFIVRSHQLQQPGFQWVHGDSLVTVWSAPNYMYKSGNQATVMHVEQNGVIDFRRFEEDPDSAKRPGEVAIDYFA
jgi:diadenosine tetraphosphatase ApaH/serine/threonine PP2A family protein phosphatase